MIYRRENATNPSKRFKSVILNPVGVKIIKKHFFKFHQKSVGFHNGLKVCFSKKKPLYKTKFNQLGCVYNQSLALIHQISLSRRYKTFVGLLKYSNGSISCLPLFSGAFVSQIITSFPYNKVFKNLTKLKINVGSTVAIAFLQITDCFFNVKLNGKQNAWFCKAGGTFCTIIRINSIKNFCTVRLPSSKYIFVKETTYVMLGRNSNVLIKGIWLSKAGWNIKKGYRPSVRGVAMNPVDHPHGGRTKSNSPERTPWGKIAKHNK